MNIAVSDVIREIRRLAAEKPNYVYYSGAEGCSYVNSTSAPGTGCGVGEAVIALGITREWLADWEMGVTKVSAPYLFLELEISGTDKEIRWVTTFQEQQDIGSTWSNSVTDADSQRGES